MKSIINKEEEKKEEIKYPCLMVLRGFRTVALFSDNGYYTILQSHESDNQIETFLISTTNLSKWDMFKGTITLSN